MSELREWGDDETPPAVLAATRRLVVTAFAADGTEFSDDDWQHTTGGRRVVAFDGELPIAHAALVPRTLWVGDRGLRTGYVEGVATAADRQGSGIGSLVMTRVGELVLRDYEMGALSTGSPAFYSRLGWERWHGPTFVRDGDAWVRTPDEDDGVMVLRCGPTAEVDLTATISCERRSGDDW